MEPRELVAAILVGVVAVCVVTMVTVALLSLH